MRGTESTSYLYWYSRGTISASPPFLLHCLCAVLCSAVPPRSSQKGFPPLPFHDATQARPPPTPRPRTPITINQRQHCIAPTWPVRLRRFLSSLRIWRSRGGGRRSWEAARPRHEGGGGGRGRGGVPVRGVQAAAAAVLGGVRVRALLPVGGAAQVRQRAQGLRRQQHQQAPPGQCHTIIPYRAHTRCAWHRYHGCYCSAPYLYLISR